MMASVMNSRLCSRKWTNIPASTTCAPITSGCLVLQWWHVEKARTLWDEMIQEGVQPDITAYNTMISGYCQSGEVGVAEDMFKNMLMGAIDSSATTFEWLVRGHCMARDAEAAMLVHADMKRKGFGLAPEVVEELLDGLCKNGRVENGFSVLREEKKRE
ncbi:Pentatricopeptide repeat-containing protein [Zea mays]|uniref:Pentatricopeptide repeat-containing protein n=1 Tax=Zea mays TaxID=4577 RepID=A0A3L6EK93_MAIZE|nr:Pentatricopeptide repeat-containing protein [Zea mays]